MKNILLIIIIFTIVIAGAGYYQYTKLQEQGESQSVSLDGVLSSLKTVDTTADIAEVNSLVATLDPITDLAKLDTELLQSAHFTILRNFTVPLFPAQTVGRANPFLEIGTNGVRSSAGLPEQGYVPQQLQ